MEVKMLRKVYGGSQTVIICLLMETALKQLAARKVGIGWITCRLRAQVALKWYLRWLGFGKVTNQCKNQVKAVAKMKRVRPYQQGLWI